MGKDARSAKETTPLPDAIVSAWRQLYPDPERGRPGDAGARAILRRTPSPASVLMEPGFHKLLHLMKAGGADIGTPATSHFLYERIALAVAILAERRDGRSGPQSFMNTLGAAPRDDRQLLSPLRFQSLMAAMERGTGEEKMRALRRAMRLAADIDFNVKALVRDLLTWNDRTRIAWTFEYFRTRHMEITPAAGITETEA